MLRTKARINSYKCYVTILGSAYGDRNAQVLCRMAGYKDGVYGGGRFRQRQPTKAKRIWLDEVYCTSGEEKSIGECDMRSGWGSNDCMVSAPPPL